MAVVLLTLYVIQIAASINKILTAIEHIANLFK